MNKTLLIAVLALSGLAIAQEPAAPEAAPAVATDAAEPPPPAEAKPPSLLLSLQAGAGFSQVLSKLGASFDGILTVGYAPFSGRQLQFFVGLGYRQPEQTTTAPDPRLDASGASYTSNVVERDLSTTVGVKYLFLPPTRFLVPYAALGARVHFLRADVTATDGQSFGGHKETDTRFGGVLSGGVGIHAGPGLILGELAFDYAPIRQRVTGSAALGSLSLVLGYGLLLF